MSQNAAEGNAAFVIWSNECLDWDNWSEAFEEDYSHLPMSAMMRMGVPTRISRFRRSSSR